MNQTIDSQGFKPFTNWLWQSLNRFEFVGALSSRSPSALMCGVWSFVVAWSLGFAFSVNAASPGYYELRIYSVTSNKMDGVLERFRDTVEPVRRKHGITTVGYWTAATTNGDKFIYLMAAASKEELQKLEKEFGADPQFKEGYAASNMKHGKTVDKILALPLGVDASAKFDFTASATPRAFDLRIYSVLPGKLDAFRDRWRDHAGPIYERHALHNLGWWVADKKDAEGHDQFVCLLAGENVEAIQKSIGEFHKDADWQRVEKETEQDGKLRSGVEAFKLQPADFSALR
ncbi:MAG: NIPSNAP family protein [Verrucomicrobiota bacterium]